MLVPFFGCTRQFAASLVGLCIVVSSSVYSNPMSAPYDSYQENSQDNSEPELAQAMPQTTDPVLQIIHSVVTVEAKARDGARTESTFGTDRKGSGVVLDTSGLIATVGYIVAEAETVTVTFANGISDVADIVAYDDSLGVGLIRTRNFRNTFALELGDSSELKNDQTALILPASGETAAKAVKVGKIKPFTSGWEFVLDDAIHTYPPSTDFSGAALVSADAKLLGIGALVSIDIDIDPKVRVPGNIFIPIDSLKSALGELLTAGRSKSSLKPWIGFETKDTKTGIKVGSVYEDGPADKSGIKSGDKIIAVNQRQVSKLAEFYSLLWTEHEPGEKIHLLVLRDGQYANVPVETVDRYDWLKLQNSKPEEAATKITELAE